VEFCNGFLDSFSVLKRPGARSPRTSVLISKSSISGSYEAVGIVQRKRVADLPEAFALAVKDLWDKKVINDLSECCLLLTSTKDSSSNAGPFMAALESVGLDYHNPRNKGFASQEEVATFMGTLLAILDPAAANIPAEPRQLNQLVLGFRAAFDGAAKTFKPLRDYVAQCRTAFGKNPGAFVSSNLQEIAFLILSLPPFDGWMASTTRRQRLGNVTSLLESYCSLPYAEPSLRSKNVSRGFLRISSTSEGVVNGWLNKFNHLFIGYLSRKGIDDNEDADVICPPGKVPIMTMHQAKGLEFPFVFVGHLGEKPSPSASHLLEDAFNAFPLNLARSFKKPPIGERTELDLIRQFFVAYSRAQYSLVLLASDAQLNGNCTPCGGFPGWLRSQVNSF
jgi:DNA helicase-2/ATP-dependent DNA helicase PcrA